MPGAKSNGHCSGVDLAPGKKRKRRRRKAKRKGAKNDVVMETEGNGAVAAVSDVLPVPAGPPVARQLKVNTSRERSPRPSARTDFFAGASTFCAGSEVFIRDLQGRTELNGKVGVIASFDAAGGRYAVRVGAESVKIKPANLSLSIFGVPQHTILDEQAGV